jgi:prephenate dehydrogenase
MGFKNIFVAGLGLIGGSFAMTLRNAGDFNIIGYDKDDMTLKAAKAVKAIDDYCKTPSEVLPTCDLIVLALYPKATIDFIKENMLHFKPGALIIDTAGIKKEVVYEVQSFLREDIEFLGTHPMAGKEEGGFKNADNRLFFRCNYILTPTNKNKVETVEKVSSLIKSMCEGKIISISPEEHDKIISYTSQLPHVIAAGIINCKSFSSEVGKFEGGSFRDMTRIAAINALLWQELLISNSEYILDIIDDFQNSINVIRDTIKSKDKDTLTKIFEKTTDLRKGIRK